MSEPFPWKKDDKPMSPRFGLTNGNLWDIVPEPVKPRTFEEWREELERDIADWQLRSPRHYPISTAEAEYRRAHPEWFDDLGKE